MYVVCQKCLFCELVGRMISTGQASYGGRRDFTWKFTGRCCTIGHESAQIAVQANMRACSYLARTLDTRHQHATPLEMSRRQNLSRSSRLITRSGCSRANSQSDLPHAIPCRSVQGASLSIPGGPPLARNAIASFGAGEILRIAWRLDGGKPLLRQFRARFGHNHADCPSSAQLTTRVLPGRNAAVRLGWHRTGSRSRSAYPCTKEHPSGR
ncbi:hypothetical protein B0J12DRAFT_331586 [Macrophomina phaseolina]|uniref:Uncharacterized protein n=1 Tax=Macrophomina phaseolina TaxID=35725 RepID=A0ABQ8GLB8_9PEZI|nr:hypothetical protein B0J12DRAFT_331586 [Macrophomina phaseolina]